MPSLLSGGAPAISASIASWNVASVGPLPQALRAGGRGQVRLNLICAPTLWLSVLLRDATPSVFHQRHIGRVLRSSCNSRGRRLASPRGREPRSGRCPPLWPVTYEMMEAAFRPPARTGARPDWMEPFARTIDAAKKYVVSSTLDRVDWNAELVRGDLGKAVQQLKRESGKGLLMGGVKLPLALAELGLIDEYELVVQPKLAGHGPTLFAGLSKHVDLKLVSRLEFGSGAVAMRYEPRR